MAKALIIGAGAIGRGFLPWAFKDMKFDLYDESESLCKGIEMQGGYHSHMSVNGELRSTFFVPDKCTSDLSKLNLIDYSVALIAVGPRNCAKLPKILSALECPVFSVENDPESVKVISDAIDSKKVFFGVPDVITSSTASTPHLSEDPYSLHTEDGILYLENSPILPVTIKKHLPNVIWASREEMIREWDAKLFLHNTPHCVAAFLGHLNGDLFLHEALRNKFIVRVIEGVIEELILAMKSSTRYDHDFLEGYAEKELQRFSNPLLYDPILRVAREPLRKMAPAGRLLGALNLCILSGVNPRNLRIGIVAALNYREPRDPDFSRMSLFDHFGVVNFMKYFLDIPSSSMESQQIATCYDAASKYIEKGLKCL